MCVERDRQTDRDRDREAQRQIDRDRQRQVVRVSHRDVTDGRFEPPHNRLAVARCIQLSEAYTHTGRRSSVSLPCHHAAVAGEVGVADGTVGVALTGGDTRSHLTELNWRVKGP